VTRVNEFQLYIRSSLGGKVAQAAAHMLNKRISAVKNSWSKIMVGSFIPLQTHFPNRYQ